MNEKTKEKTETKTYQGELPVIVEIALPTMSEGLVKVYSSAKAKEGEIASKPVKSILEEILSTECAYEEDNRLRTSLQDALGKNGKFYCQGDLASKTLNSYLKHDKIGDKEVLSARFEIVSPEEGGIVSYKR